MEELDKELEKLKQLRDSLAFDEEILRERQEDFKRVNRNLLRNIELKTDYITLSENKIKNIAENIYKEIAFYLQIEKKEPILEELREKGKVEIEKKLESIPEKSSYTPVKKKWWQRHANSNVV